MALELAQKICVAYKPRACAKRLEGITSFHNPSTLFQNKIPHGDNWPMLKNRAHALKRMGLGWWQNP